MGWQADVSVLCRIWAECDCLVSATPAKPATAAPAGPLWGHAHLRDILHNHLQRLQSSIDFIGIIILVSDARALLSIPCYLWL